jgi:hypothetical protein
MLTLLQAHIRVDLFPVFKCRTNSSLAKLGKYLGIRPPIPIWESALPFVEELGALLKYASWPRHTAYTWEVMHTYYHNT